MQSAANVNHAVGAEATALFPGAGIECEDSSIDCVRVDASPTWRSRRCSRVHPRRHTAVGEIAPAGRCIYINFERPAFLSCGRIQCCNFAEWRGDEECPVDHERCDFELCRSSRFSVDLTCMI